MSSADVLADLLIGGLSAGFAVVLTAAVIQRSSGRISDRDVARIWRDRNVGPDP